MNILILTNHLDRGGLTRYVINLAVGLSARHRVWVGSRGGNWQDRLPRDSVDCLSLPFSTKCMISPKIFFSFFKLLPFLVHNKIDVICAHTRVTQFLAYLIYRAVGIPYISGFHGFYKPHMMRKMWKFEGVRSLAVSGAVKQHLVDDFCVAPHNIRVVYNGIDAESFRSSQDTAGGDREKIRVGILGRISAEKGHFLVVDALKLYKERGEHKISLSISGEGKLKKKLQDYVVRLGVEDDVTFVSLDGEEFLDAIDILIVASSKEGFGYIILEAFAKRVAVVAYATGGIKEIVADSSNGVLFLEYSAEKLLEALSRVTGDKSFREHLILHGVETLKKFTLEQMVVDTEEVLREVLR